MPLVLQKMAFRGIKPLILMAFMYWSNPFLKPIRLTTPQIPKFPKLKKKSPLVCQMVESNQVNDIWPRFIWLTIHLACVLQKKEANLFRLLWTCCSSLKIPLGGLLQMWCFSSYSRQRLSALTSMVNGGGDLMWSEAASWLVLVWQICCRIAPST